MSAHRKSPWIFISVSFGCLLAGFASGGASADPATFTPIGFLNPFEPFSGAWSVSDDGQVVSGTGFMGGPRPVRWTAAGGIQLLDVLPGGWNQGSAFSISADGSVQVGTNTVNCCGKVRSVRWINGSEPQYLGSNLADADIDDMWHVDTAQRVSGDGNVVVGQSSTGCTNCYGFAHPYRWTADEGMISLIPPGEEQNYVGASRTTNVDGSIIAGWVNPIGGSVMRAFRWTEADGLDVIGPANAISEAFAITPDGSTIVGTLYIVGEVAVGSFRWTEEDGMMNLGSYVHNGVPQNTRARAMTADGSVIVGFITIPQFPGGPLDSFAMIWDEVNHFRRLQDALEDDYDLTLSGWILREAHGITPNGRFIVGQGTNPQGNSEGWIIELPVSTPGIPGDLNGNGSVGVPDLLILLAAWGPCADPNNCPADLNGDGVVGVADLLILLANWG